MVDVRVRGVYGTPWSRLAAGLEVNRRTLEELGACLVKVIADEARKDFAKRGWSGQDPMGGPPIWNSFSYQISGKSTLEILSSFYGLAEMTSDQGIPGRQMVWLTQDRKDAFPSNYKLTAAERKARKKKGGRLKKGERRPLVVPVRTQSGTVIFRTAPWKTSNAWIHPGIAKFTFMERAVTKGRQLCAEILGNEVVRQLSQGDPTR